MDKAKKKQIRKIVTWVLMAAVVAGLAAMPLLAKSEAEAKGPVATVHSGTVETGTVRTALHGGGNLKTKGVEDVILPTGVKITEFLVKNGDAVAEGTPLAMVDKVSVMTAVTAVNETMEHLRKEIRDAKDDKVSSTVAATAGGRIKKIFAQKGDSVQDVMLEHGALALLSLDGLMAVKIEERMELPTGSNVTVTFEDGSETEGRVESNLDGTIVVTVEDTGYEMGQTVIVTMEDGKTVGSGELYVHNAWKAAAFSGTVQTVHGKEETKVSAGTNLFTLSDTDFQGNLDYLAALHREYEELMQDLFRMYNSGTIDAPCDGIISGIDRESPHLLAAGEEAVEASLLTAKEPEWTLVLLTNVVYEESICNPEAGEDCPETIPERHDPSCLKACQKSKTCSATGRHYPECIHSCDPKAADCPGTLHHELDCIKSCCHASVVGACKDEKYPHYLDCIYSCIQSDGTKDCPATKHKPGCIESCTHADTADGCSATVHHYLDCIKSCITSDSGSKLCPASKHNANCFFAAMTYKAKVAAVQQVGSSELVVRWDSSNKEYDVIKTATGWAFANPAEFNPALLVNTGKISVGNPGAFKPGDVILDITGYKGTNPQWSGIAVYTNIASSGGTQGGFSGMGSLGGFDFSSLMGGLGGMGGFTATTPVEEESLFDLEGSVLMTVSPEKTAALVINLDEQDIAKVSVGQKATVKVEALGEEVFEATVTEIATRGVNSGGSSKFAVKLELLKGKNMLDGMSATAALPVQEKADIPVIPVMALAEQGTQTVVFTGLDEKTGKPTNPVPVTIGLTDGINAEILEGLAPGDTYYYSYYDVLEEDTGVEDRFTLR